MPKRPKYSKSKILADQALKRNPWMADVTQRDIERWGNGEATLKELKEKYNKPKRSQPKKK